MGRATGCSGRWENHFDFQSVGLSFSCPALVTDKAKRVEPVPGSKGIKESPGFFPPGLQVDCSNLGRFPQMLRRYSKAQITQERPSHCPKKAGRCPKNDIPAGCPCWRSRCQKLGTDRPFVQKLLVESGCRVSQRWDDLLLIALASGQPWGFAHHCRERRPRVRPTSTSGPGCGCAARCWQ